MVWNMFSNKQEVMWNGKEEDTRLDKFQKIIENKHNIKFDSYRDLHKWSIQNNAKFWEEVWSYLDIIASKPYDEVVVQTGPGFTDYDWFRGAKLNYAENLLRWRDDKVALICLDELGREEFITFAEMFEEVKLYSAAFRKNGLKIGDTVACFMSNRKEAIFAMLATSSIGAIWGGPGAFYGATVAANIIRKMEAKFLISIDTHQDNTNEIPLLDHLAFITENAPCVEKVVLVVSDEKTREKNLSNIRNCVFLEDFLQDGRTLDGRVPDIHFEQLPFDHPVSMNFTSGTTGLPKAPVYSAIANLIAPLRDLDIHFNLKRGDVLCSWCPVGWCLWDIFMPTFALGVTVFLYCGSFMHTKNGKNFWDLVSKYKVNYVFIPNSNLDKMEKMQIIPSPDTDLDSLKIVASGGSPLKEDNFKYLLTQIKKKLYIFNFYGATDARGAFAGLYLNMPVHGVEIQYPSLGFDIRCFDEKGKSVEGQPGEIVVCTPAPIFPLGFWKEKTKSLFNSTYLTHYPGVWCPHDECIINPKTKGIILLGRSDDTLKQQGERFGSIDVYAAIHSLEEILDYICVSQRKFDGDSRVVLFVVLRNGHRFSPELKAKIEKTIDDELHSYCIPEIILEVPDIPYNQNSKRMESVVRKIVQTNVIPEVNNIKNPESLQYFLNFPEIMNYN